MSWAVALRGRTLRIFAASLIVGDQLFVSQDRHLDPGEGGHHPGVSLVRDQADRPVFGDGEVGARDPHVGFQELFPELLPCRLDHHGDVGWDRFLELLREILGHLETAQVNGGHYHVGRLLAGQGNDPFAQVRFGDRDPGGLHMLGELDLFARHGLGLDDPLHPFFLAEIHEVGLEVLTGFRPEDLDAPFGRLRLEAVGHLLDLGDGIDLHLPDGVAEGLDVSGVFISLGPCGGVHLRKTPQGVAEGFILQLGGDLLPEVSRFRCHQASPPLGSSSTAMIAKRPGPWTPMVSTRSISAVRLGPVMKPR